MREHADTKEDRPPELTPPVRPAAAWRVCSLELLSDFRLRVRFNDRTEGVVELGPFLNSASAGVFAPLRDESLFRQARIELGAVTWPGNLDLAPDAMSAHSAKTALGLSNEEKAASWNGGQEARRADRN